MKLSKMIEKEMREQSNNYINQFDSGYRLGLSRVLSKIEAQEKLMQEMLDALEYTKSYLEETEDFSCIKCNAPDGCDCTLNVLEHAIKKTKEWSEG